MQDLRPIGFEALVSFVAQKVVHFVIVLIRIFVTITSCSLFFCSVADPGCLSLIPDPYQRIEDFNPKKLSRKYDPGC